MKSLIKIIRIGSYSLLLYFILFYLLMDRNLQALNDDFDVEYNCVFRFKQGHPLNVDGRTELFKKSSVWNIVFFPAEVLDGAVRRSF